MFNIKSKIIVLTIIPIIVIYIVSVLSITIILNNYLTGSIHRDLNIMLDNKMNEIEDNTGSIESTITLIGQFLGSSFNYSEFNVENDQYLKEFENQISPLIFNVVTEQKNCKSMYFTFSDMIDTKQTKIGFIYNQKLKKYTNINDYITNKDYEIIALDSVDPVSIKLYFDSEYNESIISYSLPVFSQGENIGLIEFDIFLGSIKNNLENILFLDSSYVFLLGSNKEIIYHPLYKSGNFLPNVDKNELLPVIDTIYSGLSSDFLDYKFQDLKKGVIYTKSNRGWILGITLSVSEMFIPLKNIQNIFLIIFLGIITASIVIAYFFSKLFINPIEILNKDVNSAIKNYSSNLKDEEVFHKEDEIGRLGKSFYILHRLNNEIIDKIIQENLSLDRLAHLGKRVGSFTHELMTPLGVLLISINYTQETVEKINSDFDNNELKKSDLKKALNDIIETNKISIRSIEQAKLITNNLKDISNCQTNILWDEVNIKEMIADSAKNQFLEHKGFDIVLLLEIDKSLSFYSCSGYLVQIFTNLIQNTFKHGFKGKTKGCITIKASIKKGNLEIDYYDDGYGINVDKRELVFEPYYTTAENSGGTGLGMHIIKSIILDYLKGSIEIIYDTDMGVHFRIIIPPFKE